MLRKTSLRKTSLFYAGVCLILVSCAPGSSSLLDDARFLLDQCKPKQETSLSSCQSAVNNADSLLSEEPTNIEAALVKSSASTSLARMDFLTFSANLADLQESGGDDFWRFRGIIDDYEEELNENQGLTGLEIDLDQLGAAITALEAVLSDVTIEVDAEGVAVDEDIRNAAFQMGMLRGIDSLVRPVKLAGGGVANVVNITDEVAAFVEDNFVTADNNLVYGGVTEDNFGDVFRPIRENYCRCSLQNPPGGTAGFNTTCLQDLMRCELYDGNGIQRDYNGNGEVTIKDCDTLLTPNGVEACGGRDTVED